MFGAFPFGVPTFGDVPFVSSGVLTSTMLCIKGEYRPTLTPIGQYEPTLYPIGEYETVLSMTGEEDDCGH